MKYVISIAVGFFVGIAGFFVLMYVNPLSQQKTVSPLSVTGEQLLNLHFSAVPDDAILLTNDGESAVQPTPDAVLELWEDTIREAEVLVVPLVDSGGQPAGIGIKFSSDSEATSLINSELVVDSAWHIYLPELGSVFVDQRENHWSYYRDIVLDARMNSADSWAGKWIGVMTTGPNALGTGRAFGGNGMLANIDSEFVETLTATAYSTQTGPVGMDGILTISLPTVPAPSVSQSE